MHYGLFGKLPARRDFISQGAPRSFLRLWEEWVDHGLGAMRASLGREDWEATFRTAPIWRFWLGSEICGDAMFGALMPSMDAVGRYFPLTAICLGDQTPLPSPPNVDPHHGWFTRFEDVMLEALDPHSTPEAILAKLAALDPAAEQARDDPQPLFSGLIEERPPSPLTDLFAACRMAYPCNIASASFWWTLGGTHYRPTAFVRQNLPAPDLMTAMMANHVVAIADESANPDHVAAQDKAETQDNTGKQAQHLEAEAAKPHDDIVIGIKTS